MNLLYVIRTGSGD